MLDENQNLSQSSEYLVSLDNYNDARTQYNWAKKQMNKILNKFHDPEIQREAYKCLKSAEENLLLTTQSLSRFKKPSQELLKISPSEKEFLNSKRDWKS